MEKFTIVLIALCLTLAGCDVGQYTHYRVTVYPPNGTPVIYHAIGQVGSYANTYRFQDQSGRFFQVSGTVTVEQE